MIAYVHLHRHFFTTNAIRRGGGWGIGRQTLAGRNGGGNERNSDSDFAGSDERGFPCQPGSQSGVGGGQGKGGELDVILWDRMGWGVSSGRKGQDSEEEGRGEGERKAILLLTRRSTGHMITITARPSVIPGNVNTITDERCTYTEDEDKGKNEDVDERYLHRTGVVY